MKPSSVPSATTTAKHIRPKVRKRGGGVISSSGISGISISSSSKVNKKEEKEDLDAILERTRKLLGGGGCGGDSSGDKDIAAIHDDHDVESMHTTNKTESDPVPAKEVVSAKANNTASNNENDGKQCTTLILPNDGGAEEEAFSASLPTSGSAGGILKKNPRYSNHYNSNNEKMDIVDNTTAATIVTSSPHADAAAAAVNTNADTNMSTIISSSPSSAIISSPSMVVSSISGGEEMEEVDTNPPVPIKKPFLKDLVVEKDPQQSIPPQTGTKTAKVSTASNVSNVVEGYTPKTTTSAKNKCIKKAIKEKTQKKQSPSSSLSTSSSGSVAATKGTPNNPIRSLSELVSAAAALTAEAEPSHENNNPDDDDDDNSDDIDNNQDSQNEIKNDERNDNSNIETDLSFRCMTNEEYEDTMQLAQSLGMIADDDDDDDDDDNGVKEVNDGENGDNRNDATKPSKIIDDEDEEDSTYNSDQEYCSDNEDDGDDDSITGFFSTPLDEEDYEPEPPERPFLKLWTALSSWVTPESTTLLNEWKKEANMSWNVDNDLLPLDPQSLANATILRTPFDTSDIGSSRCGGLMSMLKMNVPKCLSELLQLHQRRQQHQQHLVVDKGYIQRCAEQKLAMFIRTFDFSKPMAKLDGSMWKVLTFCLLEIVFLDNGGFDIFLSRFVARQRPLASKGGKRREKKAEESDGDGSSRTETKINQKQNELTLLPVSVQSVGMTLEEYRYLTGSALTSLSMGSGG